MNKILNKLTIKHLLMNKKRTLVTIIGVLLSTSLMIGVGLLFSTIRDFSIKEAIEQRGNQHITIFNLPKDKLNILNDNDSLKEIFYEQGIGFAKFKDSKNKYMPYFYLNGASNNFLTKLKLIKGRLPKNLEEVVISNHIITNGEGNYEVGDTITLELGTRIDEEPILNNIALSKTEKFVSTSTIKKKIVGIVKRPITEDYDSAGYSIFSVLPEVEGLINAYVVFKNPKGIYSKTSIIAKSLNLENIPFSEKKYKNIEYNNHLLSLYGNFQYENILVTMIGFIVIILSLVAIACIIVIYNSFAISVMERKKQFGLFSSIGATKKQLKKTVRFEAFLIALIGIPLGILASFLGIGLVLVSINSLLGAVLPHKLNLVVYPIFIIVPLVFMVITIIVSAYFPARSASKISPIEAIRLNDDLKINPKKIKTNFFGKMLGIEEDIAYKSMLRNKKKYRITIISLFISIVLFISFSSFIQYGDLGSKEFLEVIDYDVLVIANKKDETNLMDSIFMNIKDLNSTKKIIKTSEFSVLTNLVSKEFCHSDYPDCYKREEDLTIVNISNKEFEKLSKNLKKPILYNSFKTVNYYDNKREVIYGKRYKNVNNLHLDLIMHDEKDSFYTLSDFKEITTLPFGFLDYSKYYSIIIIVSNSLYENIIAANNDLYISEKIKATSSNTKDINNFLEEYVAKEILSVQDIATE